FEDKKETFPDPERDPYLLLPVGSSSLPEAVEQLAARLTPEEFADLDARMKNLVQLQFRGFNHLCNSSSTTMRSLGRAMLEEALSYAAPKLQGQDVVEMYLNQHGDGPGSKETLLAAYEEAAPPGTAPGTKSPTEFCMLATPPSSHE